jgi:hypothetical protein
MEYLEEHLHEWLAEELEVGLNLSVKADFCSVALIPT